MPRLNSPSPPLASSSASNPMFYIVAFAIGFVVGALIYRNNTVRAQKFVDDAKVILEHDKMVARNILADLNKK